MIRVTFYRDREEMVTGFQCLGHAEYAQMGADIVCAGVSALVINTINSIDRLTNDQIKTDSEAESGCIKFWFKGKPSIEGNLLIKSLILGLQGISESYGNKYILLKYEEV